MSKAYVNWAILAPGSIAASMATAMMESAKKDTRVRLYAVGSRNLKKSQDFAENFGFEKAYGSYEELLDDPLVEAVYIANPHAFHFESVMKCLEKGKHVLCEKPAGCNSEQLTTMIETAKNKNLFFMEAMWTAFNPCIAQMKKWIDEERIGALKHVQSFFCNRIPYDPSNRLWAPSLAGGALLDLGLYNIYFAMMINNFSPVKSHSSNVRMRYGIDAWENVDITFENGVTTSFQSACDMINSGKSHEATIYGTNGFITCENFFMTQKAEIHIFKSEWGSDNEIVEIADVPFDVNGYEYEMLHATDCILKGKIVSDVHTPEKSITLCNMLDTLRKDWNFKYPFEQKYNDKEMAKYGKFFNQLCKKNEICSFWWDTNLLVNRVTLHSFDKVIDSVMECYKDSVYKKANGGFIEESAFDAVKNMKTGWNLGNSLDANRYKCVWNENSKSFEETVLLQGMQTETCWFEPVTTRAIIQYVKSLGFNSVRLPVTWIGHLDENEKIDNEWMQRVREIVDYILDSGMYCILNVHHDGGASGWIRVCEESFTQFGKRFVSIYEQMSSCFKDYDERLLFEGPNEVLDEKSSWSDPTENASDWVNKWNQLFVDTVRKSGGNNIKRNLVVQAPGGKRSPKTLSQFVIPEDVSPNHLIFDFHNYDPQSFCWWQNKNYPDPEETAFWNEKKHGDVIIKKFDELMAGTKDWNMPIICGEYGAWPKIIE